MKLKDKSTFTKRFEGNCLWIYNRFFVNLTQLKNFAVLTERWSADIPLLLGPGTGGRVRGVGQTLLKYRTSNVVTTTPRREASDNGGLALLSLPHLSGPNIIVYGVLSFTCS